MVKRCECGAVSSLPSSPSARAQPTYVKSGRCTCMWSWMRNTTTSCVRMKSTFALYTAIVVDDAHVVAIVPEGVLVRNDHVQAGFDRRAATTSKLQNTVVAMPVTCVSGPAELERVAVRGVAPRRAQVRLDATDDSPAVSVASARPPIEDRRPGSTLL